MSPQGDDPLAFHEGFTQNRREMAPEVEAGAELRF